jgi:hypothetical protein
MMGAKFPPDRETDLLTAAEVFDVKATALTTAIGITSAQAAAFHALRLAFVAAYLVANDPVTRSPANIVLKDLKKRDLLANFRLLIGIVQAFPGTDNAIRAELGIPQRKTGQTPINPPATAPVVEARSASGRTVRCRLHDSANPTRRGKPAGVAGASVFSFVGATPPAALSDWTFEGNTGRTTPVDVTFGDDVAAGAVVWLTASWFNPRKQAGPLADPVSTNLPGGGVSALAA